MLKIENLNFSVKENEVEKIILKNINFEFKKNKTYVITGPNGSGKSTLVKLIMGINEITSGRIIFNDKDISLLPINERADLGISYAFQQPVTFKGLKVRQLLDIASGTKNDFDQLCDYLLSVSMCAKNYVNRGLDKSLSGGELKRIEIAMLLAKNGELNILDEPEAGIDLWSFEKLTEIFKNLKSSTNIIVSHQKKILEIADEIILLQNGEIQKVGTYEEILPYIENNEKLCTKQRGDYNE